MLFLLHYTLKLTIHTHILSLRFNYANLRGYIHQLLMDSLIAIISKLLFRNKSFSLKLYKISDY